MKKYRIRQFSPLWWVKWSFAWMGMIALLWLDVCGLAAIPV